MISLKKISFPGGADAWKAATIIFIISRFIIIICTYMAWSRFIVSDGSYGRGTHECLIQLHLCLQSWNQFDAKYFVGIAQYGYGGYSDYASYNPQHPYAAAFFPLYPLLVMFPVGVMLALCSKRPSVGKMFEMIWVTFFVINTLLFVLLNWVA